MACYKTKPVYSNGIKIGESKVEVPCPEKPNSGGTNQWGGPKGTKKDAAGNSYSSKAHARFGGGSSGTGGSAPTGTGGAGTDSAARAARREAFLRQRKAEIARRRAEAAKRLKEKVEKAAAKRAAKVAVQQQKQKEAEAAIAAADAQIKAAQNLQQAKSAVAAKNAAKAKLAQATADAKAAERKERAEAANALLQKKNKDKFANLTPDEKAARRTPEDRERIRRRRRKRIVKTKNKPSLLPNAKHKRGEAGYGKELRRRIQTELALQKQHPELFDQNILDDLGNELILHEQLMKDQWRVRSQNINQTGKKIKQALNNGDTKAARRHYKKYLGLTDETDLLGIQNEFTRLYGADATNVKGKFDKKKFKLGMLEEFSLGVNEVFEGWEKEQEQKMFGTGFRGMLNKAAFQLQTGAIGAYAEYTRKTITDPESGKTRKQTRPERLMEMARSGEMDRFTQTEAGHAATVDFQQRAFEKRTDPELGFLYSRLQDAGITTNDDYNLNSTNMTLLRRQIVPEATNDAYEAWLESDRYIVPGDEVGLYDPANYGEDEEGEYFIDPQGNKLRHGDEMANGYVPHWGTGNDIIGDFFNLTGPPRQRELDRARKPAEAKYRESNRQRIEDKMWAEVGQDDPGFFGDLMTTPVLGELVTGFDAPVALASVAARQATQTEYGASLNELDPRLADKLSRAAGEERGEDFFGQKALQDVFGIPKSVAEAAVEEGILPEVLWNMMDASGKIVTFPANMIIFPMAETGGAFVRGDDILKTYADKDEEGLVTASMAIAGWAGIGSTMTREDGEDGEAIRYDVTFEVGGQAFSLTYAQGEAVENRLMDEKNRIDEAWGTGDWGVYLETLSAEGEFFKRGNLAGALNLTMYLLFDVTNYIPGVALAKRGLAGVRAAAASGKKVDSRLLSLAQKTKAFGEAFGTNPNHAEALGGAFEDLENITGMAEEDALEYLQRALLQMDQGDDAPKALEKILDEMGLSRDVVDVKQLHAWAEEHIRGVLRHKGWIVNTQTDNALKALRHAKIEGAGNYRRVKQQQRAIRKELEEVKEAREALADVRKIEVREAAKRAEADVKAKAPIVEKTVPGGKKAIKGKKVVGKKVKKTVKKAQRTLKKRNQQQPLPETQRPKVERPIDIIDNSLERSPYQTQRTFKTEGEFQKFVDSPDAAVGDLNRAITRDIKRLDALDREIRGGLTGDALAKAKKQQAGRLKRVARRRKRIAQMRAQRENYVKGRASTTPESMAKARKSRKKQLQELSEWLGEWEKDLKRFEKLRDEGKLKNADEIIAAHWRQRDAVEQSVKESLGDVVPKRTTTSPGQKVSAGIKGDKPQQTYEGLFKHEGDDMFGSQKPATREVEDALTESERMERLGTNNTLSATSDDAIFDPVPGEGSFIWWHPENAAKDSDFAAMLRGIMGDKENYSVAERYAAFIELNNYAKRSNAALARSDNQLLTGGYDRSLAGVIDNQQALMHGQHQQALAAAIVRSRRTKKTPTSQRLVLDENGDLVPYVNKEGKEVVADSIMQGDTLDGIYDDVQEVGNLGDDIEDFIAKNEIYDFYSPMKPYDPSHPMTSKNPMLQKLQTRIGKLAWRKKVKGAVLSDMIERSRTAYLDSMHTKLARAFKRAEDQLLKLEDEIDELYGLAETLRRQDTPEFKRIEGRIEALKAKQKTLIEETQPRLNSLKKQLKKMEDGTTDVPLGGIKEYKDAMQPFYDLFHQLSRDSFDDADRILRNAHDQMVKRAFEKLPDGTIKIHYEEDAALTWLLMESRFGHEFALAPDVIESVMWKFYSKRGILPGHGMQMFNASYSFRAPARFTTLKPRFDRLYQSSRGWLANRLNVWDNSKKGLSRMANAYHNYNRKSLGALKSGKKIGFERMTRAASALLDGQIEHWQNWVPFRNQPGNAMRPVVMDNLAHGWVSRTFKRVDGVLVPKNDAAKAELRNVYDRYIDLKKKSLAKKRPDLDEDAIAQIVEGTESPHEFLKLLTTNYDAIRAQGGLGKSKKFRGQGKQSKEQFTVYSSYGRVPPGQRGVSFEFRTALEMSWGAGEIGSHTPMEEIMMFMARSQFWDDVNMPMSHRFLDRMEAWGYGDEARDFLREWHAAELAGVKAELLRHGDQNIALQNILTNDKLKTPIGRMLIRVEGEDTVLAIKNSGRESEARRLADELGDAADASGARQAIEEQAEMFNRARGTDYANPQELADALADVHLKLTKGTLSERAGAMRILKEMLTEIPPGSTGWTDVNKLLAELKEDPQLGTAVRNMLVQDLDPRVPLKGTPVSTPKTESAPIYGPPPTAADEVVAAGDEAGETTQEVTTIEWRTEETIRYEDEPPTIIREQMDPDPLMVEEAVTKAIANVMDMSEEDFMKALVKRNDDLLKSKRVSPDEKIAIRVQNKQAKAIINNIAKQKANGMYAPPKRAFAVAHRAAYKLRDRMKGIIPPRQIAYYAENADQANTEAARAINVKLQNSYVAEGGINPQQARDFDVAEYELLDELVSEEIRIVQQKRTSSIGLRSLDDESLTKRTEMLGTRHDADPKIIEAREKAFRRYFDRTGKTPPTHEAYERIRTLLQPHIGRRNRTLNLIRDAQARAAAKGTTFYDEFILARKNWADTNARRNVGWTLYENPHLSPDDAADMVALSWFNDGTIRHAPTEITEFDELILQKAFAELTGGADVTDEAARIKALNAHGTQPPMDKRFRFRSHQERVGTWSPRAVDTVIERGAWSVDQERLWWTQNYGLMPEWLGDIIDDPATFLQRETYYRNMKGTGNFDDNIVRQRILDGEQRIEPDELAFGKYDKDGNALIKPWKDIEVERQYAFERYGDRVATLGPDGEPVFHSMPWLMTPEEYKNFARTHDNVGNLVPVEAIDEVQDAIERIVEKHINNYMASHWSAGIAEIEPGMVHRIAFDLTRELASTVPWKNRIKDMRLRDALDIWSSVWRASIISQPAFILSNLLDTPTKGILFSVTDDMLGATHPGAIEAIAGLHDIGRGQASAFLYSPGSRSFAERIAAETTYGSMDRIGAVWDLATSSLAKNTLQPMENAVKLRVARQYYTTLKYGTGKADGFVSKFLKGKKPKETVWEALIARGATEEQADLILKIQVQKKVDQLFPTLESAGLAERMLNKLLPFVSYNLKNKILWVSWALDHPLMTRMFMAMQDSLVEHNRNEFMEKYDLEEGDFMPEHLFHQIRIGDDFYLDISNFTDAARGLRPLVDPGGGTQDLYGFIQNFFRPLPSQKAAVDGLLWSAFGIGGRVVYDREFDENGIWTGNYEKKIVAPLTPWGRNVNDLNEYIWPLDLAQYFRDMVQDGRIEPGDEVRVVGRLLLFSGLSEPSESYMLNMQYAELYEADPDAARDWLDSTDSGKRLQEIWEQGFFEPTNTKLDEFAMIGRDENGVIHTIPTPEQIRDVWRNNQTPEERKRLFDGWNEITAISEGFDAAIDGVTDPVLLDQLWTARRTLVAQVYAENPILGFYEGMGKDADEFSMYEQNFAKDQQVKAFFAQYGVAQVPDDPTLAEQFYKDREQYLKDNPDLVDYLWEEADTFSRTEQNIVEDYKQFFKADMLQESLSEAFEARDWQKGEDALRTAKAFAGLAFDATGLVPTDEKGRFDFIPSNLIGRLRGGDDTALYGLQMKAAWEKAGSDPGKWWNIVDRNTDLKQQYFGRNPEKRATWKQDGKSYAFWGRFSRLADKGKWDQAWDSWDNAPAWLRNRMQQENPTKFRELERSSRYSDYMGRWVGLFEAGKPQQAMEYFHSLPNWAKERYYENHPGKRFGTSSATSGRGTAYVSTLNKMFGQIDAGNWDAAERIWKSAPAWMRNRYYANNPDSTLFRGGGKGGSGGGGGISISDAKYKQYTGMMQKWVDLMRDGKDKQADAYFRSLPKWAQDFYLARNKDKALLKEDMNMQSLLMDFFGANKAAREAMKKNNPKLMKWLNENSTKAARANAIQFLYSRLPDDPWLKRVFREKYPDVFSAEAKGKANVDRVTQILTEHPEFQDAWMKWYEEINKTLLEALKWTSSKPKEILPERLAFDPEHGDSLSAEETSKRVSQAVRNVQAVNKRLPKLEG